MARRDRDDTGRAWREDRDRAVYARRRARQRRARDRVERDQFDPAPPGDDDWVVPDRSQLRRVPTGPEALSDLLVNLVGERHWDERLRSAAVFARWDEVVGTELAQHCQPIRLAGGVLTVSASSPAWATQLRYLGSQLALNVNRALDEPLVDQVHVVVRG